MSVVDLKGYFFIDTNLLIYTFDLSAPDKQRTARQIIQHALKTQRGIVSSQTVQEFFNVALRKFENPLTPAEASNYLKTILLPLCHHFPTIVFYDKALLIQKKWGYSWYDTLVITAALETGCRTLLTEDLQHGQKIEQLTIINPFV